jgi:NAD(P)-dependent dehydrogenase (short-subunit alcohol dehydrogenase family)
VLVHYGKSKEAEAVVCEIRKAGGTADKVGADLAASGGPFELADEARGMLGDRLDVLVANASISKAARIEDHTLKDFDDLFATNVRAPFFLLQQLLPILGEGSNVIVTTSIVARVSPAPHGQAGGPAFPFTGPRCRGREGFE